MCLQCICESRSYGEFLPGYYLHRSTKDPYSGSEPNEWPKGSLGIIRMNDPDFVLSFEPIVDPGDEASREDNDKFFDLAMLMEKDLLLKVESVDIIGRLYEAARQAGYDPETSGFCFWLTDHIAKWVKVHDLVDEGNNNDPEPEELAEGEPRNV